MNTFKPKILRVATVPAALYKLLKGQLSYLSHDFEIKGVCSPGDYFDDIILDEGIEVIPIEIRRDISLINDVKSLFKLYRLFKREKPDIVHSHTPKAGLLAMVAARLANVPVRIHTFTGIRFATATGMLKRVLIFMDKVTCGAATEIIPEGDGVKKMLLENKITKKNLRKIHNGNINGIDCDYFNGEQIPVEQQNRLKNDLGIKSNDFVISFIGRLVGDKGVNELVESFEILSKWYSDVKLLLVGPYEPGLNPVKDETKIIIDTNKNIIAVGLQQDVRPYLAISSIFAFPSYREGFPNVVIQAQAMGVPCVVTDISGSNEIIMHEVNGEIIPVGNAIALANAMEHLYLDREKLGIYALAARELIKSRYVREDVWEGVKQRYNELLTNEIH